MVKVIKASGKLVDFKKHKIERTVLKAGGSRKFAKGVANKVAKKVHKGMTTREILKHTLRLLKEQPHIAKRYDLKRAIMNLGPHGFTFEEFFSQLLQNYDYETRTNLIMKGKATTHEVDILAKKDKKFMIEAKYHNRQGNHTDSQVAMYTYARYLDLKNNPKNKINQGWLVTNTKCTRHAIEYAKGVGLKITTWNYSSEEDKNLQELIKEKKLYPITILDSVTGNIKEKLSRAKIVLIKNLLMMNFNDLKKRTHLTNNQINKVLREAHQVSFN
jgi:hypothetical protein